jgi:hypothetical protein
MKLTSVFCATAAVVFLAGCAYDYSTPAVAVAPPPAIVAASPEVAVAPPAVVTGPAVAVAPPAIVATSPAVVASIPGNMVCYDQFYGQIVSGFWGSDGNFHYRLVAGGPWLIDTGRHFRRTCVAGFQSVAILPPAGGPIVATAQPATSSVFYDQFYGPIVTGYWGADNLFRYRRVANGPWLVDRARHFRRRAARGFSVVTITPAAIPPG